MSGQFVRKPTPRPPSGNRYRLPLAGFLRLDNQPLPLAGTSVYIGSDQLVFAADQEPRCKILDTGLVELAWPATLADGAPLKLCLFGTVSNVQDKLIQFRVCKYEFRTRSRKVVAA